MDDEETTATEGGGAAATALDVALGNGASRQIMLMVERVTDAIVALDRDWRYVYVNARAGQLFDRDPASLIGRHIWTEFPDGVGQEFHRAYERAMETQEAVQFEHHFEPWNRWFEHRVYPSPDGLSIIFTEITERRLAEEALRESEARFRLVVRAGATMLFEWDTETGTIWREGGLLESLGYGPEANAASVAWWMDRIHPDDRAASNLTLQGVLDGTRGATEATIAYRFRCADGSYVALSGRSRLITHADGRPKRLVGVMNDSTERRTMEDALRASEARFRAFVEQASDAILVLGADAAFRYASPSVTRLLGYDPATLIGQSALDYVHSSDAMAAAEALAAGISAPGEPQRVEVRVRHADGSWRHMEASGRALDVDGIVTGVLVNVRDTTERHAGDRALRESEALFRTLADSSPVGIFQSDLDGGATYVNRRLTQIVGLSEAEMMGLGWTTRVHPDDVPELWTRWEAALRAATEFEHEYRFRLPDGTVRWVQSRAAPVLDATGAPTGTVGTIVDLTERRRLEQQLLHSQKLEAVGQLSGGIAHDFNNLLTVIQANVDLARVTASPHTVPELDEVAAAAARAAQLTRQLLAFSRRQVLQPTALDLNDVVLDAERLLRRLLGERIVVEVVLAPDLWRVRADAGQMEQVLMNLAVNARDAMPDGGTLTIETANQPAAGSGDGRDAVRLRVRDTGVGMTDDVRERAFDPFFTTKAPGVGTGLGLAMVYGIVTQSDGAVHLQSEPQAGSTFTVTLPRDSATAATGPAPAGAPAKADAAGGTERILLVEDEAAVRGVARRILERAGYTVLEARHGADALLVWREHPGAIDLVLTDVRMPEMGGLELVGILRGESPALPVVVMSGYADAGAPGNSEWFLEKPFSRDALLRCVRRALDGEKP